MGNTKNNTTFSKFDMLMAIVVIVLVAIIATLTYRNQTTSARVAYLYPLSDSLQGSTSIPNIWIAPVNNPDDSQQITDSKIGIFDFTVSPNGRYIAYSERDQETLLLDIYLLDLETGEQSRLTNCGDPETNGECHSPVFHPNSKTIAYLLDAQHPGHNHSLYEVGSRIFLLDVTENAPVGSPLSDDVHVYGHSPVWAADGRSIAYFNANINNPGVIVYHFNPEEGNPTAPFASATHGTTGTLSPDGDTLIFPDMFQNDDGSVVTHLRLADFTTQPPQARDFTNADSTYNDIAALWHPNGKTVTVTRQYRDERWTRGYQLYNMDADGGTLRPLLVDEQYSHHYIEWNTTGEQLLVQRIPLLHADGRINNQARPEIWVLDNVSGDLTHISERAYHPRWVGH